MLRTKDAWAKKTTQYILLNFQCQGPPSLGQFYLQRNLGEVVDGEGNNLFAWDGSRYAYQNGAQRLAVLLGSLLDNGKTGFYAVMFEQGFDRDSCQNRCQVHWKAERRRAMDVNSRHTLNFREWRGIHRATCH